MKERRERERAPYLPVLGLALEQHRVLGLADLAVVGILDVLGLLLGLDPVVLGEGALVPGAAGVGEEVGAHGLDAALRGAREVADGLEVLLRGPALGEDRQRQRHCRYGSHLVKKSLWFLLTSMVGVWVG